MSKVLDSFALLAFIQDEKSAGKVADLLALAERGKEVLSMSVINSGEVYYRLFKEKGVDLAEEFMLSLRRREFPIEIIPATNPRVYAASRIKARYPISLADAFAAELAASDKSPIVTGDPEFKALEKAGIVTVEWL